MGPEPVQRDGEQPGPDVALLVRVKGFEPVRRPPAELLDQPADVQGGDVGAQAPAGVGAGHDLGQPGHAPAGRATHLGGGLDLAGQRGQRPAAQLDAGPDVPAQLIRSESFRIG